MTDDIDLLRQAAEYAPTVLPNVIGGYVRREIMAAERTVYKGLAHLYPEIVDEAYALARAVLALPAPAVDREGLAKQAFQIAYDAVDWAETVEWVKPDPDDIGAVGIARVHADTIIHQAVSALISAGLLRVAGPTEQDGGA